MSDSQEAEMKPWTARPIREWVASIGHCGVGVRHQEFWDGEDKWCPGCGRLAPGAELPPWAQEEVAEGGMQDRWTTDDGTIIALVVNGRLMIYHDAYEAHQERAPTSPADVGQG